MQLYYVVFLNFCVNWLLLTGAAKQAGLRGRMGRIALAAGLGAVHAAGCVLSGFRFLGALHWRLVCLVLMSALAFGTGRAAWKPGSLFTLEVMALGGAASIAGDSWLLLLFAVAVRILSRYSMGTGRRTLLPVEIRGREGTVRLTALHDTGNELRDPVTGEPVLVVGRSAALRLAGLTAGQLADPLAALGTIPGLRLIPYHSVDSDSGLLLAMRFPSVRIGGREHSGIVAFAPGGLEGEDYQALAGGIL